MTSPVARITLRMRWRALRKTLWAWLPWMTRKRYVGLVISSTQREAALTDHLMLPPSRADSASYSLPQPFAKAKTDELCLFVTYAAETTLKPHVIHHIESLLNHGIAVILIANSDSGALQLPTTLTARLSGCMIRQNLGFDFAAWAHACSLLDLKQVAQRLYLINDSIVGPLSEVHFSTLLQHCRSASADLLGLTENQRPQRHLQSFFLAINSPLLHSNVFHAFMQSIVNLPTKQAVINLYETHLTRFMSQHGYQCGAVFNNPYSVLLCEDETILNWAGLIERGFPYLKASVIRETTELETLRALVPSVFIDVLRKP